MEARTHTTVEELTVLNENEQLDRITYITSEEKGPHSQVHRIEPRREITSVYWQGEHRLWYAALQDALRTYQREAQKAALTRHESPALREAIDWIFAEGGGLGSFYFICDVCQLEAEHIQRWCIDFAKLAHTRAQEERACQLSKTSSINKKLTVPVMAAPRTEDILSAISLPISLVPLDSPGSIPPSAVVTTVALTPFSGPLAAGMSTSMI